MFGRLNTEFYGLTKSEPPPDALEFYIGASDRLAGRVLAGMCGEGRFLLTMAKRGIEVDGVDASSDMLQVCRARCEEVGVKPNLYEQFMQRLELPHKYRFAFVPAGSFELISYPEDAQETLRRVHDHLLPGGELVVDVHTPRDVDTHPRGTWRCKYAQRPDGSFILVNNVDWYDETTQRLTGFSRFELIKDGNLERTEFEQGTCQLYEPDQFKQMLRDAGFAEVQCQRTFQGGEPTKDDHWVLYIAKKSG